MPVHKIHLATPSIVCLTITTTTWNRQSLTLRKPYPMGRPDTPIYYLSMLRRLCWMRMPNTLVTETHMSTRQPIISKLQSGMGTWVMLISALLMPMKRWRIWRRPSDELQRQQTLNLEAPIIDFGHIGASNQDWILLRLWRTLCVRLWYISLSNKHFPFFHQLRWQWWCA